MPGSLVSFSHTRRTNKAGLGKLVALLLKVSVSNRVLCIVVPLGINLIRVRVRVLGLSTDRTELKAFVAGDTGLTR